MFTIYPQIANRLKAKVPTLRTIDIDKGQLANPEQAYPMDFPAVLVDIGSTQWKDNSKLIQRGEMVIGIIVAINPLYQTRQDSPTLISYVEQMAIVNEVYKVLAGYKGGDEITIDGTTIDGASFSPLSRTTTEKQKRWDTVLAYTHVFKTSFTDRSAQLVYNKQQVPACVKTYTQNSVASFPESLE